MNSRPHSILVATLILCFSAVDASLYADAFFHESFASMCVSNPRTVRAVFENHFKQLNRCSFEGLKRERIPATQIFLGPNVIKGSAIDDAVINFCKPRSKGGLKGLKFAEEKAFIVGNVISVQWVANASFLVEPYRGSDAYVTCRRKLLAAVTTFDGSELKFKDGM